jgi:hypothetical protein
MVIKKKKNVKICVPLNSPSRLIRVATFMHPTELHCYEKLILPKNFLFCFVFFSIQEKQKLLRT